MNTRRFWPHTMSNSIPNFFWPIDCQCHPFGVPDVVVMPITQGLTPLPVLCRPFWAHKTPYFFLPINKFSYICSNIFTVVIPSVSKWESRKFEQSRRTCVLYTYTARTVSLSLLWAMREPSLRIGMECGLFMAKCHSFKKKRSPKSIERVGINYKWHERKTRVLFKT